jgi:hypothetical protein
MPSLTGYSRRQAGQLKQPAITSASRSSRAVRSRRASPSQSGHKKVEEITVLDEAGG